MLQEIKNVRQERGAGRRRWFESEELEVVVWLDAGDTISGFQLCYDLGGGDHALTWRAGHGFSHNAIDTGDDSPFVNRTPILQPDGEVPWKDVVALFERRSASLEPELRGLIRGKQALRAVDKPRP